MDKVGHVVLHFQSNKVHLILLIFPLAFIIHLFTPYCICVNVREADYLQLLMPHNKNQML